MNINDLKPIENNEDKYQEKSQEKYEIDYTNLICCNCKKNKAELIRGTQDYLCVDCFKARLRQHKGEIE